MSLYCVPSPVRLTHSVRPPAWTSQGEAEALLSKHTKAPRAPYKRHAHTWGVSGVVITAAQRASHKGKHWCFALPCVLSFH
jgi:hypothetical protein